MQNSGKVLSNVLLFSCDSCVSVQSLLMVDINDKTFTTGLKRVYFGFIAYVILILLGELFFIKEKGDRKTTLSVLTTFGSTTFFGIPIINGLLGSDWYFICEHL